LLPYCAVWEAQQRPIGDLRAMDDDNFRAVYNADGRIHAGTPSEAEGHLM
jgi:hypothetical protein